MNWLYLNRLAENDTAHAQRACDVGVELQCIIFVFSQP